MTKSKPSKGKQPIPSPPVKQTENKSTETKSKSTKPKISWLSLPEISPIPASVGPAAKITGVAAALAGTFLWSWWNQDSGESKDESNEKSNTGEKNDIQQHHNFHWVKQFEKTSSSASDHSSSDSSQTDDDSYSMDDSDRDSRGSHTGTGESAASLDVEVCVVDKHAKNLMDANPLKLKLVELSDHVSISGKLSKNECENLLTRLFQHDHSNNNNGNNDNDDHHDQMMNTHFQVNSSSISSTIASSSSEHDIAGSSNPIGLDPSQIRAAYGLNLIDADGTGQTVAVIDAYSAPTAQSDFQFFDAHFNLGNPGALNIQSFTTQADAGWALESALDCQWIHAVAPKAKIILVSAKSSSLTDLLDAVQWAITVGKASVISMSWGSSEFSTETKYDSSFAGSNVVFLASSGDSPGVFWPSSSPNVLSVGGTTLTLNANNTRKSETAWLSGGGGSSRYERIPLYQSSNTIVGKYRETPDVAIDANPTSGVAVYDSYGYQRSKGWIQVGGTSLSSVLFAGVVCLANQLRQAKGKAALNNAVLQKYIYSDLQPANVSRYGTDFYDVTAGSNAANKGYDPATGLGSPSSSLIHNLVNLIA